jgi:SAM-dependent methyltransferase
MLQVLKDFLLFPVRAILNHEIVERLGLTSLREERMNMTLKHSRGKIIDIGCGEHNLLINKYRAMGGRGIGIDVYPWPGVDKVCDTTNLPFPNKNFDTVTLVGVINHIPIQIRKKVLKECYRILNDNSRIVITTLNPFIGLVRHKLAWWDKDQHQRGMKSGEEYGLHPQLVKNLLIEVGFRDIRRKKFVYGLNNLYLARK